VCNEIEGILWDVRPVKASITEQAQA
jgi:hypothetical protein